MENVETTTSLVLVLGMWAAIALSARRAPPLARLARAAPALAFVAHWSGFWRYHVDDAGISYAYASSLASGGGLRPFAEAPVVEGFSNPAWTLLLAAGGVTGLEIDLVSKIVQLLLGLVTLELVYRSVRLAGFDAFAANGAAGLVATSVSFVVWSSAGLENGLLAALLGGAAAAALGRKALVCALLAAGVSLTRPEGIVLTLAILASLVSLVWLERQGDPPVDSRRRRPGWILGLVAVVPWLAYGLFRALYFHDLFPNTFHAKLGGSLLSARVSNGADYLISSLAPGWMVVFPLAAIGAALRPQGRRLLLAAAPALAVGLAFVLYAGGDWMEHGRFLSHLVPLIAMLGVPGLLTLLTRLPAKLGKQPAEWLPPILCWLLLAAGSATQIEELARARRSPTVPLARVQENGRQLRAIADSWCGDQTVTVASPDIGGLLWPPSDLRIIDLAGLIDREAAARGRDRGYWIDRLRRQRPAVVATHGPWTFMTRLTESAMEEAGYRLHCRAPSPAAATSLELRFPYSVYRRDGCSLAPDLAGLEATRRLCG